MSHFEAALIVTLLPRLFGGPGVPAGAPAGRYQSAGVPGHMYVLDTATGQLWEQFAASSEGSTHPNFNDPKAK